MDIEGNNHCYLNYNAISNFMEDEDSLCHQDDQNSDKKIKDESTLEPPEDKAVQKTKTKKPTKVCKKKSVINKRKKKTKKQKNKKLKKCKQIKKSGCKKRSQ